MNIVAIIQARMTSSRLPGKILLRLPYGGEKTVLEQVIGRLQQVNEISRIVVATTINLTDDIVVNLCRDIGVEVYRGSENHVLGRFYEIAKQQQADHIIRVTSDCPCLDAGIVSDLIQQHLRETNDYTTNALKRCDPHGLDCEVIRFSALEAAYTNAFENFEIEHVTPYIYKTHSNQFRIGHRKAKNDAHRIRVTLDTKEDYILLCQVYDELYSKNAHFNRKELVRLFQEKPWLSEVNGQIEQKKICSSLDEELKLVQGYIEKQDLFRMKKWLQEKLDKK